MLFRMHGMLFVLYTPGCKDEVIRECKYLLEMRGKDHVTLMIVANLPVPPYDSHPNTVLYIWNG